MRIGAAATFAFVAASVAMSVAWSSSAAPHVTPAQGKKELDAVSFTPGLLNDGTRARARALPHCCKIPCFHSALPLPPPANLKSVSPSRSHILLPNPRPQGGTSTRRRLRRPTNPWRKWSPSCQNTPAARRAFRWIWAAMGTNFRAPLARRRRTLTSSCTTSWLLAFSPPPWTATNTGWTAGRRRSWSPSET